MAGARADPELYHEIFGSVLDRHGLSPYLLDGCADYASALRGASQMMGNRGFILRDGDLAEGELNRANGYVRRALDYLRGSLFRFLSEELGKLAEIESPLRSLYRETLRGIGELSELYRDGGFVSLAKEDPRHLFLMASQARYPHLLRGCPLAPETIPRSWRHLACSLLKTCHLVKSIEEDSQDIYDFACLGFFFKSVGVSLDSMFDFDWSDPRFVPEDQNARRAFVELSAFFQKLHASIAFDHERDVLTFRGGNGLSVDIAEVKARLKGPESMFAKLGKDAAEEAFNIRDILAVTFILREREDSLALFHALQMNGVILQENTASASITQTLFRSPADMAGAVDRLMRSLARRAGREGEASPREVGRNARDFYKSLSVNDRANSHSSDSHRKIQFKINYSVPVCLESDTRRVVVPGMSSASGALTVRQHTLPVELRISDAESWRLSELRGEAHHQAYKCRQLLSLADRLFSPILVFPREAYAQLRKDQAQLYR